MTRWLGFGGLAIIWGSGFLWTRLGVDELPPATFVLYRLVLGALALVVVAAVRSVRLRALVVASPVLAVVGVLNMAGTFTLISWAQQFVPSGIASILVGATPFFATAIGVASRDERLTVPRVVGLSVGFVGLIVLYSGPEAALVRVGASPASALIGAFVILVSALIVASCAVIVRRRFADCSPLAITMTQLVAAIPFTAVIALLAERTPQGLLDWEFGPAGLVATVWMGVLGAGVANLVFYWLILSWGVTRTTLIAYVMPVVGVLLGVVVLDEAFDLRIALATGLVVVGLVLVNLSRRVARPGWLRLRAAEREVGGHR